MLRQMVMAAPLRRHPRRLLKYTTSILFLCTCIILHKISFQLVQDSKIANNVANQNSLIVSHLLLSQQPANDNNHGIEPISQTPVYILPQKYRPDRSGELKHLIQDGIERSRYLKATENRSEDGVVWFVDRLRAFGHDEYNNYCAHLFHLVNETYYERNFESWKVILLDITDFGGWSGLENNEMTDNTIDQIHRQCAHALSSILGRENVVVSIRSHNVKRNFYCFYKDWDKCEHCEYYKKYDPDFRQCFDEAEPFRNHMGEPVDYTKRKIAKFVANGSVLKAFYPVRSDIVDAMNSILGGELYNITMKSDKSNNLALPDPVDIPRNGDVRHFWNHWHTHNYSMLRSRVSDAILSLNETTDLMVHAGLAGDFAAPGRNFAHAEYVHAMLSYKIIVVSQRDEWEGHYRLMEAMISGAMVMTDPMVYLPAGFEDGFNVVVYTSIHDLKQKIQYYCRAEHEKERLTIARAGVDLVMSRHRSWHYMEDYILRDGRELTMVSRR